MKTVGVIFSVLTFSGSDFADASSFNSHLFQSRKVAQSSWEGGKSHMIIKLITNHCLSYNWFCFLLNALFTSKLNKGYVGILRNEV